jgi:hypothetical protein
VKKASDPRRPRAQRFRAAIEKQGPNPYVDVPQRVSRALLPHARAGRVTFEGLLNKASIRGTVVSAGRGRQRLYINGGMRAAAGVALGDTVTLELRPTDPDTVRPPADVAAGLRRVKGAATAFEALTPSHRRELLRYIDDARTPETRRRRIEGTADHLLAKRAPLARGRKERPLWACPRCGNEFVNRNQWHSCKRPNLEEPFEGKPQFVRDLFERFRKMVEACGPVKLLPYRDKVGFMVRVRFAGAIPKTGWLEIGFWLPRRVESPRFRKVETISLNAHVHLLRVTEPKQLDREVASWLEEAYAVGCQKHLACG